MAKGAGEGPALGCNGLGCCLQPWLPKLEHQFKTQPLCLPSGSLLAPGNAAEGMAPVLKPLMVT